MNHLAHALLSGADDGWRLGGLLGDFVRGRMDPRLPLPVQRGIAQHRAIDAYTDNHAEIRALRARFQPPYRRYAGILIDIWFDHLRPATAWTHIPLRHSVTIRAVAASARRVAAAILRRFLAT
jgi:acyl carrier protein phosphodiesterase